MIPKVLGKNNTKLFTFLDEDDNKVLVHDYCHKLKTSMDRKLILSSLLQITKSLKKFIEENKLLVNDADKKVLILHYLLDKNMEYYFAEGIYPLYQSKHSEAGYRKLKVLKKINNNLYNKLPIAIRDVFEKFKVSHSFG